MNARVELERLLVQAFPWCREWAGELKELFRAYALAKRTQRVLDYDDLLLYWAQMMALDPIAADVGGRFDFVLVDEYQDTNALQAEILLRLKPDGRGLTVVGDDAQAIYGFRAATVRNILDFPGHFTPPAAVLRLEQNYRSTQPILDAANAVMQLAPEGFTKSLFSVRRAPHKPCLATVPGEDEQVDYVVRQVLENREAGLPLREQAVLFRTGHHSARLELELGAAQHPVRQVRRAEVRRDGAREGSARISALGREPARSGRRVPGHAAAARRRPRHGAPGARSARDRQFRLRRARPFAAAGGQRRAVAGSDRAPDHPLAGCAHLGRPARAGARLLRPAARGAV